MFNAPIIAKCLELLTVILRAIVNGDRLKYAIRILRKY